MYHLLKIEGILPLSPTCIKIVAYQNLYGLQLAKHLSNPANCLNFAGTNAEITNQINALNLRPLYYHYFRSIPAGVVPHQLMFNNIPYYNFFISNEATSVKFVEIGSGRIPPIRLALNTMAVRTNELPPYFLNLGVLDEGEREHYLNTLTPQLRELILNEDFNNPEFQENITPLTIHLREYLGNNWINLRNDGLL